MSRESVYQISRISLKLRRNFKRLNLLILPHYEFQEVQTLKLRGYVFTKKRKDESVCFLFSYIKSLCPSEILEIRNPIISKTYACRNSVRILVKFLETRGGL